MFFSLAIPLTTGLALAKDDADGKATETHFGVGSEVVTYDNLDFRKLDETSDQAILDSDDRTTFGYLWVGAQVEHEIGDDLGVDIDISHRALWGGDQVGTTNAFGGLLYVRALDFDWAPGGNIAKDDDEGDDDGHVFLVRVGRQRMSLGGLPHGASDYVYDEITDGVRVDVPLGDVGVLRLLPISIVSSAGDVANSDLADLASSGPDVFNFRGATLTTRMGGILALDHLVDGLDARAHFFYTDMGAAGTGSDISYHGMLGNFVDNDYVANYGVRAGYATGPIALSAEFDGSLGVDRKELVAQDVNTSGIAGGATVVFDSRESGEDDDDDADGDGDGDAKSGVRAQADVFFSQGAGYTANGLQYTHGYVGMKGSHIPGMIAGTLMGWRPAAYSDDYGVIDDVHDRGRRAGTLAIHAGAAYEMGAKGEIGADVFSLKDQGVSAVNFNNLDAIIPPYGYTRDQFKAEQRLGKGLGTEIDAHAKVQANDHLKFFAQGGALLPGAFYAIPAPRAAGNGDDTELGGTSTAWAVALGTELSW